MKAAAAPGLPAPTVTKAPDKKDENKKDERKKDDKADADKKDDDDLSRGHSPAEDLILREGEEILADYVLGREREGAPERQKANAAPQPKPHAPNH